MSATASSPAAYSTMETDIRPAAFARRQRDGHDGEPVYRHGSLRASDLHADFPSAPASAAALFLPEPDPPDAGSG
jgi:cobyrinic acid a,c-diamide synthase